jgi:hypothetical protein
MNRTPTWPGPGVEAASLGRAAKGSAGADRVGATAHRNVRSHSNDASLVVHGIRRPSPTNGEAGAILQRVELCWSVGFASIEWPGKRAICDSYCLARR